MRKHVLDVLSRLEPAWRARHGYRHGSTASRDRASRVTIRCRDLSAQCPAAGRRSGSAVCAMGQGFVSRITRIAIVRSRSRIRVAVAARGQVLGRGRRWGVEGGQVEPPAGAAPRPRRWRAWHRIRWCAWRGRFGVGRRRVHDAARSAAPGTGGSAGGVVTAAVQVAEASAASAVGPPLLQGVQEAGFEFGGDVAVDVLDLVGDAVAEASGLGDVGDVVGDQPGLVAVPEPVEGQPGRDRRDARCAGAGAVGGAVGGGAHGAAGEVGAAQERPVRGDEHVSVAVAVEVLAQQRRPGTAAGRWCGRIRRSWVVRGTAGRRPRAAHRTRGSMTIAPVPSGCRWGLARCSPVSSPQRAPVQAAVRMSRPPSGPASRAGVQRDRAGPGRGWPTRPR